MSTFGRWLIQKFLTNSSLIGQTNLSGVSTGLKIGVHKLATAEFRTSDYLDSPDTTTAYLEMAMEDPDPAMLMMALRNIAEAKGMKEVAGETGLNLQTLYRTLSDKGNPTLQTLTSLLHAYGLRSVKRQ